MSLRELAEAAKETWPLEDDAVPAFAAACSPERILALLDVAEAAEGTSTEKEVKMKKNHKIPANREKIFLDNFKCNAYIVIQLLRELSNEYLNFNTVT